MPINLTFEMSKIFESRKLPELTLEESFAFIFNKYLVKHLLIIKLQAHIPSLVNSS